MEHPRLKPISIAFLLGIVLILLSAINLIISICMVEFVVAEITKFIGIALLVLLILVLIGSLIFCEISNFFSEREFERYSDEELNHLKKEIEKEWPDFFHKQGN